MAPDAHVTYVGGIDCTDAGLADALAYIVNHHTADIVTNSWGESYDSSTLNDVYDLLFQVGAVEGMGFFFSSGDSGYEDPAYEQDPALSDKIQVDYPTSSPWVTSVGGTSLAIGKSDNYKFETSWGTVVDPLASGGGAWSFTPPGTIADQQNFYGVSTAYAQPWYQKVVVPKSLATAVPEGTATTPMRVVPDVAALADPSTGILVGETLFGPNMSPEKFYLSRIGGTSVASPIFAGIEADAQQAARHPLGFANPVIYALAAGNQVTKAFRDVTDHPQGPGYLAEVRSNYTDPFNYIDASGKVSPLKTFLRTLGINGVGPSALPAVNGYDDATGVGSPEFYVQAFRGFGFGRR
jgi:subtilase family serine protease